MEFELTDMALAVSLVCCGIVSVQALCGESSDSYALEATDQCFGCGLYSFIDEQVTKPEICEAFVEAEAQDGDCHLVQNVCVPMDEPFCGLIHVKVGLICMRDEESPFCINYGWNWVPVQEESVWDPDAEGQVFGLPEYNLRGACGQANYNQNFAAYMAKCDEPNPDPEGAEWAHHLGFSCFPCFRNWLPN